MTVVTSRFDPDPPHDEAACFALHREQWAVNTIARFTVRGEPVSKARARFTGYGSKSKAYTPQRTKDAEERVAWAFRQAARGHRPDPDATYGVMALFFAATRQRRDVDNMLKLICDGLNGIAWVDDAHVVEVSGRRALVADKDHARTEVWVYAVGVRDIQTQRCSRCRRTFVVYDSWKSTRKYCSRECDTASKRDRRMVTCGHCGEEFDGRAAEGPSPKYCSTECSYAARRTEVTCSHCSEVFTKQRCHVRRTNYCTTECATAAAKKRRSKRFYGTCQSCGAGVTRKEYVRCKACRMAGSKPSGRPKETP